MREEILKLVSKRKPIKCLQYNKARSGLEGKKKTIHHFKRKVIPGYRSDLATESAERASTSTVSGDHTLLEAKVAERNAIPI